MPLSRLPLNRVERVVFSASMMLDHPQAQSTTG
jgi:hypothetical protein